jgi:xanthine/uracil permease
MEHIKHHVKHMAIAAAVIIVVLVIAGVDLGQALRSAVVLACPLGMIAMMFMMGRHRGEPADHHDVGTATTPRSDDADAPTGARHH